jgi:hypothetical protein
VRRRAERVAYNQEGDIDILGVAQDFVAVRLDHLAVGDYDGAAIVGFLLWISVSPNLEGRRGTRATYQDRLVHEEDAGVGLEVHPRCLLYDLKTLDGNIRLI